MRPQGEKRLDRSVSWTGRNQQLGKSHVAQEFGLQSSDIGTDNVVGNCEMVRLYKCDPVDEVVVVAGDVVWKRGKHDLIA